MIIEQECISVIIPAYNSANNIEEAIDSMLNQTYQNIEVIVIEDGSSDNTIEVVRTFDDNRLKLLINEQNKGIVFSLNKGISYAKGEYIARMDSDDISFPERLSKQLKYLKQNDLQVCGSSIEMFSSTSGTVTYPIAKEDTNFAMLFMSPLAHPTAFGLSSVFKKYGYRDVAAEDYDLWKRISIDCLNIGNIPEILLRYRVHPGQASEDKRDIIKSSIVIAREYAQYYISDKNLIKKLDVSSYFMKENQPIKDIYDLFVGLCYLANKKGVTKDGLSMVIDIIFKKSTSVNPYCLVYYYKALVSAGLSHFKYVNSSIVLQYMLFIHKNSKFYLFLRKQIMNLRSKKDP